MRKVLIVAAGLLLAACKLTPAHAGGVYVHHPVAGPVTQVVQSLSKGGGGVGGGSALAGGAAWVAAGEGVVVGLMVGDEWRRSQMKPACATGKPRQSWFGKIKDEPKLWRKACKSYRFANYTIAVASKPIKTTKVKKLWPNGK
jgi:hypothetical protein